MNTVPDLIPASLRALWQEAWAFCAYVLHRFDRDDLRAGIRRASGVRISIWLGGAESALRRLIVMAALALAPAPLKPRVRHALRASKTRPHKTPPRSFSVFRLHGAGVARGTQAPPPREPAPYGHIRFPADPILALGRVRKPPEHHHNGGPILPRPRAKNPLDRRGRLSRNDPDWRPPPERPFVEKAEIEIEPDDLALYGFTFIRFARPHHKPTRLDSRGDWRRCYDEWEKRVPATQLAARLDALERMAGNPDALIRRTARRLQSHRTRTLALARAAWPKTSLPRRARRIATEGFDQDIAVKLHACLNTS